VREEGGESGRGGRERKERARDTPVNPAITRIRTDLIWENVVYDYLRNMPSKNVLNGR